jgi:hypothetical protein
MPSDDNLKEIFLGRKTRRQKLTDSYLYRPVLFDIGGTALVALGNWFLIRQGWHFLAADGSALHDILNELISTSLSSGGFVLAALAILASLKQQVEQSNEANRPTTGRSYFFNSKGYRTVVNMYKWGCIVFVFLFLYFSFVRGLALPDGSIWLLQLTVIGTTLLTLTFLRCIFMLWVLIGLKH